MAKLIVWMCGIALAFALFAPSRAPVAASGAVPVAMPASQAEPRHPAPLGNGFGELVLQRSADGHFYADGQVNGAPVHFLVDTGASTVALSRADAQSAGLQFGDGDFSATGEGAGGTIRLKPVTLDRVTVGALEATQVDGVIVDGSLPVSLLGQSWLKRVGAVTIADDRMVLR